MSEISYIWWTRLSRCLPTISSQDRNISTNSINPPTFWRMYCHHLQGQKVIWTWNQQETGSTQILKMNAVHSSKTWVDFYQTTWCYIREDSTFTVMGVRTSNSTETDLVLFGILNDGYVQKPSSPKCNTPSSESFWIDIQLRVTERGYPLHMWIKTNYYKQMKQAQGLNLEASWW